PIFGVTLTGQSKYADAMTCALGPKISTSYVSTSRLCVHTVIMAQQGSSLTQVISFTLTVNALFVLVPADERLWWSLRLRYHSIRTKSGTETLSCQETQTSR